MSREIQLFCVPYAGGYAEVFAELAGLLEAVPCGGEAELSGPHGGEADAESTGLCGGKAGAESARLCGGEAELSGPCSGIEVIPLEYPGHGGRKKEPCCRSFDELTADTVRQIRQRRRPECPYAILGYSMGSIVAYEALAGDGLDAPAHIFLAAHEAPDVEWECKSYSRLEDDAFLEELMSYGGFSEKFDRKLLGNRFFRRLYFDPIRSDYELLASYRMKKKRLFEADVTVFYAPKDIPPEAIRSWDRFAGRGIEYVELGENHFFLKSCAEELAAEIRNRLL